MKMYNKFFNFIMTCVLMCFSVPCKAHEWPNIYPFSVSTGINFLGEKAFLSIPFFDKENIIRYRLTCRGIKESYLDHLKLNYVGPWMCLLNKGNVETEASLFDRNRDLAPWYGRGVFYDEQLIGACGSYPEYGRVRNFRLRGFVLTLAFTDLDVRDDDVVYGVFNVSVKPDPSATSKYAETPKYLDPFESGRSCERVLLRDEEGE